MKKAANVFGIVLLFCCISCSTHFTTLNQENSQSKLIFQISENDAFACAYRAITTSFPGRNITNINGPLRGYSTYFRIMLDTFTQQIMVIPAVGITEDGKEVYGFYFEVSGSGTTVIGRQKNVAMFEELNATLLQSNKGVYVKDVRTGEYQTTVIPSAGKTENQTGPDPADRLRQLKKLRDEGVITDEEYERKKKEILEKM